MLNKLKYSLRCCGQSLTKLKITVKNSVLIFNCVKILIKYKKECRLKNKQENKSAKIKSMWTYLHIKMNKKELNSLGKGKYNT
jgi:hypothetical protein